MSNQSFKVKNSLHLTPQAVEPSGLEVGDLWMDIDGNLKRWDGSASQDVGSGGVGSVDIMFAQTLEQAVIGDFTTTGTVAITEAPLEVLQGDKSLKITHTGGASVEQIVEVPIKYRGKNVTLSLDVASDALSGNLTLTVTDETNTVTLINAESIQPQEAGQTSVKRSVSFNVPSDCEELKYKFTAVSESGKISYIDNVVIELTETARLSTTIETPIITNPVDAGPITITSTGTFPTKGTTAYDKVIWHREGRYLVATYRYSQTSAGFAGTGEYLFTIPNGLQVDTSIVPIYTGAINTNTSHRSVIGTGARWDSGPTHGVMFPILYSSTQFRVRTDILYSSVSFMSNMNTPFGLAGVTFTIDIKVPILGWEATETQSVSLAQTVLVQESDSQLMAKGNAGQAITANVTDIPFTLVSNEGSDINFTGTTFSVNSDGIYEISVGVFFTTATGRYMALFANGAIVHALTESLSTTLYSGSISLNLSQGVNYSIKSQDGGGTLSNLSFLHYLTVTKQGSLKQLNVSENQKIEIPTSELRMEGASTRGSTATAIVRFDNIAKLRGDAFTVESDATLGTRITMKKKGKLSISACVRMNNAASSYITKNQTVLTSFLPSVSSEILSGNGTNATANVANPSWIGNVDIGDVIRITAEVVPALATNNNLNLSFQEQEVSVSVTNVLPQFSESDSSVRVDTANGYGSTATLIRRFGATRENLDSSILYVDDPVNGGRFEIKESGNYNISYTDNFNNISSAFLGISKNASSLITSIASLTTSERLASAHVPAVGATANCSWEGYLQQGDVIRAHVGTAHVASNNALTTFTISKVGKPNVTGVDVTPFAKIEYEVKQFIEALTATSTFGGTRTGVPVLNITKNTNNGLIRVDSSAANGTEFVALKRCEINVSVTSLHVTSSSVYITKNSTIFTLTAPDGVVASQSNSSSFAGNVSATISLEAGDIVRIQRDAASGVSQIIDAVITATELRDAYQVIGGGVENTYSARIANPAGTASITSQSYPFIQSVSRTALGVVTINLIPSFFGQAPAISAITVLGQDVRVNSVSASTIVINTFNTANFTDADASFDIILQRQGSDYRTPSKAIGLPAQRIAYVQRFVAPATSGGTSVAGAWNTVPLATVTDPSGIGISVASNQMVIPAGSYDVSAFTTLRSGDCQIRIRNITDSSTLIVGAEAYGSNAGETGIIPALAEGRFTLTATKTIELQYRVSVGAAYGLGGMVSNYGENILTASVRLEKIEE